MDVIKETIQEILDKMTVSYEDIEISLDEFGNRVFLIKTNEAGLLIGSSGECFNALTHLVKKIVSSKNEEYIKFSIDINNYQADHIKKLKEKALIFAHRARSLKTEVVMEPCSSYERMIIHGLFTNMSDIETESNGVEPTRCVVIRYRENTL